MVAVASRRALYMVSSTVVAGPLEAEERGKGGAKKQRARGGRHQRRRRAATHASPEGMATTPEGARSRWGGHGEGGSGHAAGGDSVQGRAPAELPVFYSYLKVN